MTLRIRDILIFLLILPSLLQARSVVELTLDGGYSSTQYHLTEGKLLGGIGYGADVGYAYFFHKNVGLGLGVGFRHYAGGALIDGVLTYPQVIDTDKEPYNHTTTYSNWQEKQNMYYLEFPVSLQFYVPLSHVHLWMAVGANYSLALYGNTAAQGDLVHRGYYPKWDLTLDIPAHGFYETSDFKPSSSLKPLNTVAVFARLDIGIPVSENMDIIIGAKAHYAVLSAYQLNGTTELGFRNDKDGWRDAHYFMTDYSSLLNTPIVKGNAYPWSVDLEIGIKYSFPTKQSCRHCKQLNDNWRPIRYRKRCAVCD